MPFVYDHINTSDKHNVEGIHFSFNDLEVQGRIIQPLGCTKFHYEHVGGSAGVSTVVTSDDREYLVEDYFISVFCEDVEAFVRHQTKKLTHFSLTILDTDGDQKMLETNVNRMCRCLESSLQSRTQKLKVDRFCLSVLEISQVVSAVDLLDRDCLGIVTVRLPFEDQVFTAEDFIPLIEGQGRQRLYLTIQLYKFSSQELEEVRKLLNYSSQLNCITIDYKTIDEQCLELIPVAYHLPDQKNVIFPIDHVDDPIKEMAMINLSDNKCHLNILEVPSIMSSIASNLEFSQIQSLRKVSRGIRQCVDYVKPEPHILFYDILLGHSLAIVTIQGMTSEKIITTYFGSLEQQADQIVNDFDLNTRHQKSCMDHLFIDVFEGIKNLKEEDDLVWSKLFKGMRDVLISRTSPIKVEKLGFSTQWQCLMMNILPYLDAEYLECIIIRMFKIDEEYTIELDEISKSEQWSKAKELNIKDLTVRTSIQDMNILNFEKIEITLETMSQEDIMYSRKNLPQSPVFQKFKILIKKCLAADFLASLGEPYRVVNNCKYIWYFRMENTQDYLHVTLEQFPLQTGGRLQFIKVHQNKTPFF
ncbi:hypothetical protein CRE_10541 [Caenorhabditis remanei]|uniref:DUF38 domain-containing protein n=1 Tax=Caenorhabditis remanei TaxID=31234 RepID=E3N0S5_CAERE|nr:hypothetical protein CRE_10541 [Caenorhabditis remanei]